MYSTPWVHAINYAVSTEITSSLWWWWWCHCNDVDHKKVISKILKVPQLQVGTDSEGEIDEIFFIWPTTLVTITSSCSSSMFHKTLLQGAQNWQREPFLQHERSRLLEEALRDRRSPRGSYWADWELHSGELSTFGQITQTKKQIV